MGFLKSDNAASLSSFEEEVKHFTKWCSDNFLQVNVTKTKELVIDFRRSGGEVPPTLGNKEPIERVRTYKYLRVEIDQLKFNDCATAKVKKLHQRMFLLRKLKSCNDDRYILQLFYKLFSRASSSLA